MTSSPPPVAWHVVRSSGPADAFHRQVPDPGQEGRHQLWIHSTAGPALILGSTQPGELVDDQRAAADGIEVCRRRSGGGLVYLDPTTDCWIDALVPAGSPLWQADVGLAFHWMGQAWAAALDDMLGPTGPALVNRHGNRSDPRRRPLWCFAELGHGEVTIGASKVVGLSQRRTRHWVRLQSLVLGRWPGRRLLPYLDLDVAEAMPGCDPDSVDPATVAAGPPPGIRLPEPDRLAAAFLDHIGAGGGATQA